MKKKLFAIGLFLITLVSISLFLGFSNAEREKVAYSTEYKNSVAGNTIEHSFERIISFSENNDRVKNEEADYFEIIPLGNPPSWHFNIGTEADGSISPLRRRPSYGRFDFDLRPGDILHEDVGLASGNFAGHTAIVEGRFYCAVHGYYWRLIESAKRYGGTNFWNHAFVMRSVLDDARFTNLRGHIIRPVSHENQQTQGAVAFAVAQLGKPWTLQLDSAPLEADAWMCSTLVWAAYRNQGIQITVPPSPPLLGGVLPMHIFNFQTP